MWEGRGCRTGCAVLQLFPISIRAHHVLSEDNAVRRDQPQNGDAKQTIVLLLEGV